MEVATPFFKKLTQNIQITYLHLNYRHKWKQDIRNTGEKSEMSPIYY
jgi:hypothetical protein